MLSEQRASPALLQNQKAVNSQAAVRQQQVQKFQESMALSRIQETLEKHKSHYHQCWDALTDASCTENIQSAPS